MFPSRDGNIPNDAAKGGRHDDVLILSLNLVFILLAIAGILFPDSFLWGIHNLSFVPVPVRFGILFISLVCALPIISRRYVPVMTEWLFPAGRTASGRFIFIVFIGVAAGMIFYLARTSIDMYGDAKTLLGLLAGKKFGFIDVLRFDDYEPLTRYIHQKISDLSQINQRVTYQIVSSLSGALFIGILSWFVMTTEGSPAWRFFVFIVGVFCGTNQLFFGYVEDYTLAYLAMFLFLVLAWKYFEGKNTLPWMVGIFLIGIKLHIQMVLFAPALCYLFLYRAGQRKPSFQRWRRRSVLLTGVVLSALAMFVLYIFVFHAARLETGTNPEKTQKIFLPLFNYLPDPHNYSLLSPSHIGDIIQELLLAVAPGVLVVIIFSLIRRKSVSWSSPRMIFYLLGAIYFLIFDLTVDPLLTPMRDWDMLSLVSVPVMFVGMELSKQWFEKDARLSRLITGVSLGLALLPATFFYVNADKDMAAERLRELGVWAFHSYYAGSAYMVNIGCALIPEKEKEIAERENIIRRLEPAASHPDMELGFLYHKLAVALQSEREYDRAIVYYKKALEQDPYNASAVKGISLALLLTGHFDAAAREIARLNEGINSMEVNDFDALRIAELAHRCSFLQYRNADASILRAVLEQAQETFLH
jgi:hypothetical protein